MPPPRFSPEDVADGRRIIQYGDQQQFLLWASTQPFVSEMLFDDTALWGQDRGAAHQRYDRLMLDIERRQHMRDMYCNLCPTLNTEMCTEECAHRLDPPEYFHQTIQEPPEEPERQEPPVRQGWTIFDNFLEELGVLFNPQKETTVKPPAPPEKLNLYDCVRDPEAESPELCHRCKQHSAHMVPLSDSNPVPICIECLQIALNKARFVLVAVATALDREGLERETIEFINHADLTKRIFDLKEALNAHQVFQSKVQEALGYLTSIRAVQGRGLRVGDASCKVCGTRFTTGPTQKVYCSNECLGQDRKREALEAMVMINNDRFSEI